MIKDLKKEKCLDVLKNNYLGHLAYISKGAPYVVPITYYYDPENHCIVSYSAEGFKIKAMRTKKTVSFQVEEIDSIHDWRSVLVHGLYEELHQIDAKYELHEFAKGVKRIISSKENHKPSSISEFSSKLHAGGSPIVFRLKIVKITGKQRAHEV